MVSSRIARSLYRDAVSKTNVTPKRKTLPAKKGRVEKETKTGWSQGRTGRNKKKGQVYTTL